MAKKKTARKKTAKKKSLTKIESVRHNETRKNIPTEELRDFVRRQDQQAPPVLYPRDPSLDPQLDWKGKDAQDGEELAVPTVPIYIQEKIHNSIPRPQGEGWGEGGGHEQLALFSDFNGLPDEFDQRVDFYQHDGHWLNQPILRKVTAVINTALKPRLDAQGI